MTMVFSKSIFCQSDSSILNKQNELQEFVVHSIKVDEQKPITQTTLNRKQIEAKYFGADVPSLINSTPSVNMYSDNGTGIGYSFFRLRGMDQTRINTTVNGIPINDPENQGVFFNNFADLMSSAESVQIQRGIGTSTNGTSAFGGSINILTKNLNEASEVSINEGVGSFNSQRTSVEMQSGLLQNKFMFYARFGQLNTDGYRKNSGSQIRSYLFSAGYKMKNAMLKFNAFGGFAENQLSYLGVDKTTLDLNAKSNSFINGESDKFNQQFYQLQYTYKFNANNYLFSSVYFVRSSAPQFQFMFPQSWGMPFSYFNLPDVISNNDTLKTAGNMMTSYRLNQTFYGGFLTYNFRKTSWDLTSGIHVNSFSSNHFMEINYGSILPLEFQQNHRVYFNTGNKNEASVFIKFNEHFNNSKANLFVDLQSRISTFKYKETPMQIRQSSYSVENMKWLFFNWRCGFTYTFNALHKMYLMQGQSSREPTRFDYFQDDFATHETKQNDIKSESVLNSELGYEFTHRKFKSKATIFLMQFENQIIGLGQLNNFGYPVTTNVKASYRMGLELDVHYKINNFLQVYNQSSFSKNKIDKVTQFYKTTYAYSDSVLTYNNVNLALSPSVIINQGIKINATQWLSFDFLWRYVSIQYLDNSEDKNIAVPEFNFLDSKLSIQLDKWIKSGKPVLSIQLNNLLNEKYCTSGSVASATNTIDEFGVKGTTPLFFAAAGRNYFVTLSWKF